MYLLRQFVFKFIFNPERQAPTSNGNEAICWYSTLFVPGNRLPRCLLRNATRYSHTFSKIGNQLFALKRLGLSPISIPIPIAIANFLVGIGIRNRDRTRRFAFLFIINPDASGWFARNDYLFHCFSMLQYPFAFLFTMPSGVQSMNHN